jgi:hypothetical protein
MGNPAWIINRFLFKGSRKQPVADGSPLHESFTLVCWKVSHPFEPGSGFRHIIIKGERAVVKSIVPGLSATVKFAGDADKLRFMPTFCIAQARKAKKMGEKIGFLRSI